MVTITQENSFQTRDRAMGTTNGRITESLRGGGMRINNTVLGFTLVLKLRVLSLVFGRWANISNGLQILRRI